jgi:aromatic ring-opening dioxygenase catalytic subunit (LigB family)
MISDSCQHTLFIPHGGGPCFFMDDPGGVWTGMAAFLRALSLILPAPPTAILLVSAHWEQRGFVLTVIAETSQKCHKNLPGIFG